MQPAPRSTASLLIFLTLLMGSALLFLLAVGMFFSSLLPLMTGSPVRVDGLIYSFAFGFETLLLVAAAYFCFQKYQLNISADQQVGFTLRGWHIPALVVGLGAALGLGYLIAENAAVNWLLLPILTIPAAALPVILVLGFGTRRLPLGPRWQAWSIFGLGMTVGPLLLIVIEILILILIVVFVSFYLASQPGFMDEFGSLINRLSFLQDDPEAVLELLSPYLMRPGVIFVALSFFAVIVPFTEELLKPIGVWLFAGKLESPAQGFALGALSGGAYALVETLGSGAQTTGWAELLFSRTGTTLLHITCTGLMGWAIASAWKERKVVRLFALYLASSALHGIWNASVILFSFSTLAQENGILNPLGRIGTPMLIVTLGLVILLGFILLRMNRQLARNLPKEPELPQPDVVT